MTGMFPSGGVVCTQTFNAQCNVQTIDSLCEALYYAARCNSKFDPSQANAVISELMNLVNMGEVAYDCSKLDNVERAVRYIAQRGLTQGLFGAGGHLGNGTSLYAGDLNPGATRYNDYMPVVIVPETSNIGPTSLNINGLGNRPILRNDGLQIQTGDLRVGVPKQLYYWKGSFYFASLAASQVPLVLSGSIDGWIRPDGNDLTGDGTANTPGKAFKTIAGAWRAIGSRYAASPIFTINLRLGLPGSYEGASLSDYGGSVTLHGNVSNPGAYRVTSMSSAPPPHTVSLGVHGISNMRLVGVTIVSTTYGTSGIPLRISSGSSVILQGSNIFTDVEDIASLVSVHGAVLSVAPSATPSQFGSDSGNRTMASAIKLDKAGSFGGGIDPLIATQCKVTPCIWSDAFILITGVSVAAFGDMVWTDAGSTGKKHNVRENSILRSSSGVNPGSVAGTTASGGQVI